jgi:acyl-CoA dehydrogenase family protein 9
MKDTTHPPKLDLSAAKLLFLGKVEQDNFFPFPKISKQEQETISMVLESVDKFMQSKALHFREYDQKGGQPSDYINELKELGLFGLIIPEEYGGIGLSNSGYSRVLQQVTTYDGSTSLTVGAHSSIGMKGLLLFGTDAQKEKYLPKLSTGEMIAAFCLTEPGAGSDAASIKTTAVKQSDGSFVLNGEKLWITNGPIADFFTVFARTDSDAGKITGFIVERGAGLTHGVKEDKMGIRASATSTIVFQDMKIPAENVLGEEGKGFKVAMAILNNGRTGLGGGCVGAMKRSIIAAVHQADQRKQFGKSISEYQLIKEKISQMTIQCYVTESIVSMVGYYIDSGFEDYSVEAAMSKIFASESLWYVGNEALQIAGGNGFMKEYPYEVIVRDSRINLIFEGTNEILRIYIALSAINDIATYLKDLQKGIKDVFSHPIKGYGLFKEYAGKKVSEFSSFGRPKIDRAHEVFQQESEILEEYVAAFSAKTEEVVKKLGKKIVGSQIISKRLSDCAIDLFACLCVISRVSTQIEESTIEECRDEIEIAKIFTQQAKRRINQNLRRLDKNEDVAHIKLADSISKRILENKRYPFDTLDHG